jgi:hypothetical protein
MKGEKLLLVGDNPFLGVSHLSQERSIARGSDLANPDYCAGLVKTALQNGADGFMFTLSDKTISILKLLDHKSETNRPRLYAMVPYMLDIVRTVATSGGITGLAKKMGLQVVFSGNLGAIINGFKGAAFNDPASLLKSYLSYEVSRLKAASGPHAKISSIMFHEVVTDMAISLNMRWLFETHIKYMLRHGIKPGFETRNFAYLVKKFEEWNLDFSKILIAAPFNAMGFQMCPSREECEKALARHPETEVIGFSIMAAGYIKLPEAAKYAANASGLDAVAVGVSKERHATETFKIIRSSFSSLMKYALLSGQ